MQAIIITSISRPTAAIRQFAGVANWTTLVVGDRKTPTDWQCPDVIYISADDQLTSGFRLAHVLPWNHYCRKMLGYLHAIREGAQVIVDTDDDNFPKTDWAVLPFTGTWQTIPADHGYVNIYRLFTEQHVWPRGFPLDLICHPHACVNEDALVRAHGEVGVWQGLADGDPDVDAIYRLTLNQPVTFSEHEPVVLGTGTICPFNSQNTAFRYESFPLLYLPAFVNFRFTDILRSLIAQPILWAAGYHIGFTRATVNQERNPHDYLKDFLDEQPCYRYASMIAAIVRDVVSGEKSIRHNLRSAYQALAEVGIIQAQELTILECWLSDLAVLGVGEVARESLSG